MENLKRYYLDTSPCYAECGCYSVMDESESGEWVKFDDIKELLNSLHNKQSAPCYCKNELAYTVQKVVQCGKCGKCWLE
jgi:hypothetical protein